MVFVLVMFISRCQMFVVIRVSCFVLAFVVVTPLSSGPASGGSFLLEPGSGQVIQSTTIMTSRLSYDARGALAADTPYRKIESSLWTEFGLTRNVTLIANPVLRDVAVQTEVGTIAGRGLGSMELGARWRLFDYQGDAVSFQATTRVAARSDPVLSLENRPRTELRLGYGFPALVNGKAGFADSSLTWVKRHEAGRDEVRHEMTIGWWQRPTRMVLIQYYTTFYPVSGLRHAARQDKVLTSTVYKLNDSWSFQLGSFFTRGGHLTRRERGTVMALWRRF